MKVLALLVDDLQHFRHRLRFDLGDFGQGRFVKGFRQPCSCIAWHYTASQAYPPAGEGLSEQRGREGGGIMDCDVNRNLVGLPWYCPEKLNVIAIERSIDADARLAGSASRCVVYYADIFC